MNIQFLSGRSLKIFFLLVSGVAICELLLEPSFRIPICSLEPRDSSVAGDRSENLSAWQFRAP